MKVRACPLGISRTGSDSLRFPPPLKGVLCRSGGCNCSVTIIFKIILESHPPSLRDTSLEGGGLTHRAFSAGSVSLESSVGDTSDLAVSE